MRRRKLTCLALATVLSVSLWGCGSNRGSGGDQAAGDSAEAIKAAATYVGSTKCLSCHGDKENWGHTLHKLTLRKPGQFSKYQAKGEDFYAGTINKGLDLLTASNGQPDTTVYFYNIGGTWHASQTNDAGQAANLKFSADVAKSGDDYTFSITNIAGTAATKTYPVVLTYGGERNAKQRYVVQIGNSKYISPIQYNDRGADADAATFSTSDTLWVAYNPGDWYDTATNALKEPAKSKAFDGNCAGCHFTGYSLAKSAAGEEMADAVNDPNGEIDFDGDGTLDEINIGCEACHGAGSAHVATLNPAFIVNPANLTADKANMVCGQCHIRGETKDDFSALAARAKFEFPAKLDADGNLQRFRPGNDIADFYEWDSGTGTGKYAGNFWGVEPSSAEFQASKKHHQQYIDMLQGPHVGTTCFACHELHDNRGPDAKQIVPTRSRNGVSVRTSSDDNTLCLSCHAGFGIFAGITPAEVADVAANGASDNLKNVVTAHTQHKYDPAASGQSNCVSCHMPATAQTALKYDVRSHTFEVIQPKAALSTAVTKGVPNACSACHTASSDSELNTLQNSYNLLFVQKQGIFQQWAATDKADPASPAWNNYNWAFDASRAACQRCHTATGANNYLTSPGTYLAANNNYSHLKQPWAKTDSATFEVLTCKGCHAQKTTGLHTPGAITADYGYVSSGTQVLTLTNTYPDLAGSNVCMACHTGRESGDTIRNLATANGVTINFGNLSFINSHYLTAGGTLFTVTGYEFTGRSYANTTVFVHDKIGLAGQPGGSNGPCVGCHLSSPEKHSFLPVVKDGSGHITQITSTLCASCHIGSFALTPAGLNELEEEFAAALEALKQELNTRGYFFSNSHPYFFRDNNPANGVLDTAEISSTNGVKNWLTAPDADATGNATGKNNMGAAFNYNLLAHDPGAYAHNQLYARRLIFDSIDWLDNNVLNGTINLTAHPDAAAYLNPASPVGTVARP